MPTRKQRELREKAAQVRTNGEYNEDAAAWLDRWMTESDEGTRNDRECMAFDAMLDAYGLGGIPSGQWNSLFDHATRINTIFEKATTWMNEAMMGEVTNYSPTATFDEVILTGIELLKPDGADGDPTGIHAEPNGTLLFGTINIEGEHRKWKFDTIKELADRWYDEYDATLPDGDDPVTYASIGGSPVNTMDGTFFGLLKGLGIDNG